MNKLIFELIQSQNGNRGLLWTKEDKEEFAELLIKECAQICQTISAEQVDNASKDYQEGREMGATVCRNQIKKHFGVE